jgi:hypothetical protein
MFLRCKDTTTLQKYFANNFSKENFLAITNFIEKYLDIVASSPLRKFYLKSVSWL